MRTAAQAEPGVRAGAARSVVVAGGWAVALGLFCYFGTRGANEEIGANVRAIDALGWVLVLVAPLLLSAVWLSPRMVFGATSLLVAVYIARAYTGGPVYLVPMAAAAVLAWRVPLRGSYPPVATAAAGFLVAALFRPTHPGGVTTVVELLIWMVVPVVPWALVMIVRMNRLSAAQTADEQRRRAADEERMQVAREVHDVVGHSLAVISMQAGVALHVAERRPEQLTVALDAIARSSREALSELRGTLAVFVGDRPDTGERTRDAPASGLDDVGRLVADFAAGGHPVEAELADGPDVPREVGLAVFRVVQESLTNTARHAGAVPTTVRIGRGRTATCSTVVVDVDDDGPGRPAPNGRRAGTGLAGMRERCEALGGALRAGPRAGGGWSVHAELPLEWSGTEGLP